MTQLDFESDQFLQLLTDALRSGPGSPAWHEAVDRLKTSQASDVDEYRLLLEAREQLESGKGFRQVRAGPKFTQKVLAAVQREANRPAGRSISTTTIIAIIAGIVGLAVVGLIVRMSLFHGAGQSQSLAELQAQTFGQSVLETTFARQIPSGWRSIGPLDGVIDGDFRPPAASPDRNYQGCGLVTAAPLPADKPASITVSFRPAAASDGVILQVFVTDQPDFTPDRGTSPHELVWQLHPTPTSSRSPFHQQLVLPDGTFAADAAIPISHDTTAHTVRLAFNADFAVADFDGVQLHAGPHQLTPSQPRYVGFRILRRGPATADQLPAILSVQVNKE